MKLHGSVDWHLCEEGRIWRVRESDTYPTKRSHVLIYPQSTKYIATQRDPFAAQFDLLRRTLSTKTENVLAICGYSFGDEHINQEIELVLRQPDNKTTVLAFSFDENPTLERWQKSAWGKQLYVISPKGVSVGGEAFEAPRGSKDLNWWTFQGVSQLLANGPEACIK